jgi:DHA1 family multidrug resistance protein-like MFS transporter
MLSNRLRLRRLHTTPAFWLLFGQLVMFTGVAALFPVAPLYVAQHGGGSVDIALFVAGPLIANTLVQVPAGRLVDRIGRRPMLIGSRLLYALFSVGLFINVGPLWLLAVLRMLQGATGGAYVPAMMAALTDLSEPGQRGVRFSQMQACEMVGLLLGPAIGGAVALWQVSGSFGVAGLLVLVGLVPMWRVPETRRPREDDVRSASTAWWRQRGVFVPSIGLLAIGAVFSMYDVVWPQYLSDRGNSAFVIGLSISFFALPILLLARRGGRISDRSDRRKLVPAAMVVTACTAASYPFLQDLAPILAVGTLEAIAFVFLEPSLYAVIGETAAEHERGRMMGIGGFFQFSGSGFGSAVLGSTYGLNPRLPFFGSAALLVACAAVCALLLPRRAIRVRQDSVPPPTLPHREGEPV